MIRPFTKIHGLLLASIVLAPVASIAKGFDVKTLTTLDSIHSGAVSPNGEYVVYGLKKIINDTKKSDLYLQNLTQTDKPIKQLTNHKLSESNVVWAHDNNAIYFLSERRNNSQIWMLPLTGGEAIQVTDFDVAVDAFKLSPDGNSIVATMTVFNECETLICSANKLKAMAEKPTAGKVYNQLMVRHWDTWKNGSFSHLFVGKLAKNKVKSVIDITKGLATDTPSMTNVTFTPDSKSIVYSAKAPGKDQSDHTNYDLWQAAIDGSKTTNLTVDNLAWDAKPVFSDDGRYMAYAAMEKPMAESDRFAIMLKDLVTGTVKEVAPLWDRSVREIQFAPDSRNLVVTAQDLGQVSVFLINIQFGDIKQISNEGSASIVGISGTNAIISKKSLSNPGQLYSLSLDGAHLQAITDINSDKLKNVEFGQYSQFSFKGWNDETVYGYWVKPAGFKAGEKYPIAFLIHGGPQGSFGNNFSTRWNPQLWAGAGYGVVMIDFHGSTGYGQQFTQSINQDWGGKPLEDLQKGLDAVTKQQPWLDANNACALGASYGGYMVNWIEGNWSDKFKCLVNHAGLFDMRMFYNVTEESWFPNYDFGGSYQQVPDSYEKFNPVKFVNNWKTPMLVIHGEKDFRVPYGQSLAAFTVLQKNNIDSKLIIFPEENHWISNNDNKIQWYNNVLSWMNKYTKK
jgi:dipeptidyl aminopeptidase/acylaminoacyl peptidase